jgi:hypothetical protein
MDQNATEQAPSWLELESVIPLESTDAQQRTVKKITNLSADTIVRKYPQYVVRPSDRRVGMKLRHALAIASKK